MLFTLMRGFGFSVFFLIALCAAERAHAAAWTLAKGEGQAIINYYFYTTDTFVDQDGNDKKQRDFVKNEINPYVQYGVRDDVTVGISPRVQHISQKLGTAGIDEAVERSYGLSEAELFIRKRVWKNDQSVVSLQALAKLPGFYDQDDPLPLGDQQVDYEFKALYGYGFKHRGYQHFVNIESGYRFRAEDPSDEWRMDTALGYQLDPKWMLLAELSGVFSTEEQAVSDELFSLSTSRDLVKAQLSAVQEISDQFSVQMGAFQHVYARNTGADGGFMTAIWYHF